MTEPLHTIAQDAAVWLARNQGPLAASQADDLRRALRALPDEELGDALFSLQRVAGYFHERLESPAVAAQVMDICFSMTPDLLAAADRLIEKRLRAERSQRRAFDRITAAPDTQRAAIAGTKPIISVNTLRPPTKFK
jgi:hypothetical protein